MAILMEGINWDEVNAQGNDIMKYFFKLKGDIYSESTKFADDLSVYWASGNAVDFERVWNQKLYDIQMIIESCEENVKNYLKAAFEIYSTNFNTSNKIYIQPIEGAKYTAIENVFKETNNGITGMNKNATDTCVSNYKSKINEIIDEFSTNATKIHLSIIDAAGAQSSAFSGMLERLKNKINKEIDTMVEYVEKAKTEEQDRLELAKTQTTNTFYG